MKPLMDSDVQTAAGPMQDGPDSSPRKRRWLGYTRGAGYTELSWIWRVGRLPGQDGREAVFSEYEVDQCG